MPFSPALSTSSSIFRKFSCFFSSCCSSSSSFRVLLSESYCFSEDLPAVLLRNLRSFSVKNIPYRVLFSTGFSQSFYLSFLFFSRRCSSISAVLAFSLLFYLMKNALQIFPNHHGLLSNCYNTVQKVRCLLLQAEKASDFLNLL